MDEEQLLILRMVQDGTITPEQADVLLTALPSTRSVRSTKPATSSASPSIVRDMQHFHRSWEIPFGAGVLMLVAAGFCVSQTNGTMLHICGGLAILLAGAITIIGWLSQYSPWVHVRIRNENGNRFAISLPLPLRIAKPLLNLARPLIHHFADDTVRMGFDTATTFVSLLDDSSFDEPLSVEFDDDGGHVKLVLS